MKETRMKISRSLFRSCPPVGSYDGESKMASLRFAAHNFDPRKNDEKVFPQVTIEAMKKHVHH